MPDLAWVDGWVGPLQDARVSVLDRGFLFGDGAYEVVRCYDGRFFELQAHLRRLESSLRGLQMSPPMSRRRLTTLIEDLVSRSGIRNARIYLQVTRGRGRRDHAFPRSRPTLVAWVEPAPDMPARRRWRGFRTITMPDPRWQRCHLKALVLLPNVLARHEARSRNADEALLLGPGGIVREGAASNVFIIRDAVLRTHPTGREILPGVSRQVVLDLARQVGLRVIESRFRVQSLQAADEVFLSSTTLEVMPVVRVDDRVVAGGRAGAWTRRLHAGFVEATRSGGLTTRAGQRQGRPVASREHRRGG